MINLLPPSYAARIRYGRHNAVLRRWIIGLGIAIAGLLVILGVGSVYIDQQSKNLRSSIENSEQQLKDQNLSDVEKNAEEISSNIKIINKVLSQEIRFSELIQSIGKLMPNGSVLASLTLTKVDGAIDLSVNARDYNSVILVAANLGDPKNELFDKVDIVNVNCNSSTSTYKCNASLRVLFSKDAQTRFLNAASGGSQE